MSKPIRKTAFFSLFIGLICFTFSCSIFPPKKLDQPVDISPDAQRLLEILRQRQSVLQQFKAIGKISIDTGKNFQTSRAAWAVKYPQKLRIEFLAPTGHSTLTVALDETWLYIYSNQENRFIKKRKTGSYLKKLLGIPIKADDVVSLFAGNAPIDNPIIKAETTNASEATVEELTLHFGNRLGKSKIFFDKQFKRVNKFERFDASGVLTYRAVFEEFLFLKNRWSPRRILLEEPDHGFVKVFVEKYWTDITLESELFVLQPNDFRTP